MMWNIHKLKLRCNLPPTFPVSPTPNSSQVKKYIKDGLYCCSVLYQAWKKRSWGTKRRFHKWIAYCWGPEEVHCWVWSSLNELFLRMLLAAIPEAKQSPLQNRHVLRALHNCDLTFDLDVTSRQPWEICLLHCICASSILWMDWETGKCSSLCRGRR